MTFESRIETLKENLKHAVHTPKAAARSTILTDPGTLDEPLQVRKAKAFALFLMEAPAHIYPEELIVGILFMEKPLAEGAEGHSLRSLPPENPSGQGYIDGAHRRISMGLSEMPFEPVIQALEGYGASSSHGRRGQAGLQEISGTPREPVGEHLCQTTRNRLFGRPCEDARPKWKPVGPSGFVEFFAAHLCQATGYGKTRRLSIRGHEPFSHPSDGCGALRATRAVHVPATPFRTWCNGEIHQDAPSSLAAGCFQLANSRRVVLKGENNPLLAATNPNTEGASDMKTRNLAVLFLALALASAGGPAFAQGQEAGMDDIARKAAEKEGLDIDIDYDL